jgi:hypothetical protein
MMVSKAVFPQGQRRMHTAVVELDALADAVRTTTQHHDLLVARRQCLALVLIGGVKVRRGSRKLGSTGIDPLVDRADTGGMAVQTHRGFIGTEQLGQTPVSKALALELAQLRSSRCP